MKTCTLKVLAILVALVAVEARAEATAEITIDSIEADQEVSGRVLGISQTDEYKVVVFVKTDQWYIHPFATGGKGRSYAEIKDGRWSIPTVDRGFPAQRIAALVVKRGASVPSRTQSLAGIDAVARVVLHLVGTPDHGKL